MGVLFLFVRTGPNVTRARKIFLFSLAAPQGGPFAQLLAKENKKGTWLPAYRHTDPVLWTTSVLNFSNQTYIFRCVGRYMEAAMAIVAEMLRPTEAAVVASVALRDINRAIDEKILPDGFVAVENGRRVLVSACTLISFYFASAKQLTSEERLFAIREIGARFHRLGALTPAALLKEDWLVRDDFVMIDLGPFVRQTGERMDRLAAARELVSTDPAVLGGAPVIRGTRIPVHDVAASVAADIPIDRILAAYPALNAEKIGLAVIYAEAYPARGRPRSSGEIPKGAVIVSDRRVRRREMAK